MREVEAFIARYWGKARGGWHPLAYHEADVAACALAIAEARPWMLEWIAERLGHDHGWSAEAVCRMVAVFAYTHDVGKHALGFQVQAEDAYRACTEGPVPAGVVPARGPLRHDALGLLAWIHGLPGAPSLTEAVLGAALDEWDLEAWEPMASAAFGHHGHPTCAEGEGSTFPGAMRRDDLVAACASCARFHEVVGSFPPTVDPVGARAVSIPLAGLLQVADWMGSDRDLFDYSPPDRGLRDYWEHALGVARRAVAGRGLVPVPPAPWKGAEPIVAPHPPSPMQKAVAEIALDGPFLAILEDTMGSGKTEAALILAARAMAEGLAHGVFVGLPTTATADGQAARQVVLRKALFADGGPPPSLTVAHGRSDPRRWPLDPNGAPLSGSWIADERRLRLLADLAVGTVDQALLGVMATEFSAVRRFALMGKVLVIDEVHAYDAYTLRLVEDLVREHAALGGSVVLLSATLTAAAKTKLLAAFREGAPGRKTGLDAAVDPAAPYPALTILRSGGAQVVPVKRAPMAPPDKEVRLIQSTTDAEVAMLAAAGAGCAAWIRLTVDDCIASAMGLAARHHDVTALHSRMPEAQRRRIEAGLLARFEKGKVGEPTSRRGGLVVATSVIASSLDLDFDLVVIDLRGMDELLQALGRGRRHRRASDGRLLPPEAADERPQAPMLVLAPDPGSVTGEAWLRDLVGWGGAKVAGNTARAWRTAFLLRNAGWARYGGERGLIEAAACPEAVATPPDLAGADAEAEAAALGRRGLARATQLRALRVQNGYLSDGTDPADDEIIETRIDEVDAVEVVLVEEGGCPIGGGDDWSAGRIRIPKRRFGTGGLARAREIAAETGLPRGTRAVPVRRDGAHWVHNGTIVDNFTVDERWGLYWTAADEAAPATARA